MSWWTWLVGFFSGNREADVRQHPQIDAIESRYGAAPFKKRLLGDGTWPFAVWVDGDDLVWEGRATCWGGADDPQDKGETASGISTKKNPGMLGCSVAMDGRMFPKMTAEEHEALDGSPIPRMPWGTKALVTDEDGKSLSLPIVDLGPAKSTCNVIDLTVAAARKFKPGASARNFSMTATVRVIGGAKWVPQSAPRKS